MDLAALFGDQHALLVRAEALRGPVDFLLEQSPNFRGSPISLSVEPNTSTLVKYAGTLGWSLVAQFAPRHLIAAGVTHGVTANGVPITLVNCDNLSNASACACFLYRTAPIEHLSRLSQYIFAMAESS